MELFKVTVTPEQQAATQARLDEFAQSIMQMHDHLRANIPALRMAARLDEALQQQAVAPTTARG
ncbi:hypothetical protein [[Kitasatospora] papulosa]|uniref:hypothetical protein n=1 Tax=[Kitasatospora] papulosa TaxID=1464011 RepID=UPI0036D16FD3